MLRAIKLGAAETIKTIKGETIFDLAILSKNFRLLLYWINRAGVYFDLKCAVLFAEAAKAQEWEFCERILQKENIITLNNQRIIENGLSVSALYYFIKYGKFSLAAHLVFGEIIYSDEQPLLKSVMHLCEKKSFNKLYELICASKASEEHVCENSLKQLFHGVNSSSRKIYHDALNSTDINRCVL